MPLPPLPSRALALGRSACGLLSFLPPLLSRLFLGHAFYLTGRGKLGNPEGVTAFFTGLGIPFPELNAAFVSRLEYYGAMLLMVGLLTRVIALLLGSTMAVALLTAHRQELVDAVRATGEGDLTAIAPLVLLVPLLWLVVHGAGALSVDRLLARWIPTQPQPQAAPGEAAISA